LTILWVWNNKTTGHK